MHLYCPDIRTDFQILTSSTASDAKHFCQALSSSKLKIKTFRQGAPARYSVLWHPRHAPAERYTALNKVSSLGDWFALSFSGFCPECGFFRLEDLIHLGPDDASFPIAHTLAIHRAHRADFKPCRREPDLIG